MNFAQIIESTQHGTHIKLLTQSFMLSSQINKLYFDRKLDLVQPHISK